MWSVMRDKRGRRTGMAFMRYPESNWRMLLIQTTFMAPGPEGPIVTDQFEAFREGLQECEARITIERGLKDEAGRRKMGADLVKRCEEYLDMRHNMLWLTLSSLQLEAKPGSRKGAYGWRWGSRNVAGDAWCLGSNWQERTGRIFELAGEVERKLAGRGPR